MNQTSPKKTVSAETLEKAYRLVKRSDSPAGKRTASAVSLDDIVAFSQTPASRTETRAFIRYSGKPLYAADPNYPGLIVEVSPDGTRRLGRLVNRKFVECVMPSVKGHASTDKPAISADHLTDLVQLMTERGRRLLLFGRQPSERTSLVKNAADRAKGTLIYCDITTATDLHGVALRLMAATPKEVGARLKRSLSIARNYLANVRISDGKIIITGEPHPDHSHTTLDAVLNYFNKRAARDDQPWTVCLDGFEALYTLGGPRIDWRLRGLMQEHRNLNYILIISDYETINRLAGPKAPFYKQRHQMEVSSGRSRLTPLQN
ncbi:MAG: hypothetical protein WC661_01855 [Opitutaceae bacterium]